MSQEITVLVYPVGKAPLHKKIDGSLESMQEIVKGYIQYVNLGSIAVKPELDGYDLYCNETGKLDGLEPNIQFPHDVVCGNFFISKADDEGNAITLTNEDIEKIVYHMETL